ncbi:MAG: hypothetical protein IPK69_06235 [Phycisphaerales bacterium]|nr:MAG: hypothetical protein IPK69_06235 [Phycisphaerales bacterium]
MPPGKGQRPLFDLVAGADQKLREHAESKRARWSGDKPVIGVELQPKPQTNHEHETDLAESIAAPAAETDLDAPLDAEAIDQAFSDAEPATFRERLSAHTMLLPRNALWIGIAGIAIAIVLVWVIAYSMGRKDTEKELIGFTPPPDTNSIKEPGDLDPGTSPKPIPNQQKPQPPIQPQGNGETQPKPPQNLPPSASPILTHAGTQLADPREPGSNYLALAILTREKAEDAIAFLAQNSVKAFALPLDPASSRSNNADPSQDRYRLYALPGFPGGKDYSRSQAQRTELVRTLNDLGTRWQRERRGTSNFRSSNWERFDPQG